MSIEQIIKDVFKKDEFVFKMDKDLINITIKPNVQIITTKNKVEFIDNNKELFVIKKNKVSFKNSIFLFLTGNLSFRVFKVKKLIKELKKQGFKQEFNNKENIAIFLR